MSFCVCDNGSSLGYGKFVPSSRVKQPEYKLGRRLKWGPKALQWMQSLAQTCRSLDSELAISSTIPCIIKSLEEPR